MSQDVYIVDCSRTPFIKAQGKPNALSASELAVQAAKPLLERQNFDKAEIEELILGCVAPSADEANIARIVALRLGLGDHVMGWTVQRNCASGLQSIDCAFKDIAIGRHDLVLAGGTEAMSRAPLLFRDDAVNWFAGLNMAKTFDKKFKQFLQFRPKMLAPVIALLKGLTDPVVNMTMGQTAEKIAEIFDITRKDMDSFAVESHKKAVAAYNKNYFDEIAPVFDWQGKMFDKDNGIREDSSLEKLAKLRPVFDKPFGNVTAGNSSQVTDGAGVVLMASKAAVERLNLKPIAKINAIEWQALDPKVMGLGPAHAIAKILQNNNMQLSDIDCFELNEAFAAQVIGCVKALDSQEYCREKIGVDKLGLIDDSKLNIDGGAIACGHPVGASATRLVMHLMRILERQSKRYGIATLCIGGGQGGALLLENVAGGL